LFLTAFGFVPFTPFFRNRLGTRKSIKKADEAGIPLAPPTNQLEDLTWVLQRMSP